MDIVFCTDNNYVMPCGIAITSLLENNKDEDITIHILGLDLTSKSISDIEIIKQQYSVQIEFYFVDQDYLSKFNFPFHPNGAAYITIAAYIKLFLEEILPKNLNKILYLDADIMVVDRLLDLWNTDISNYSVAGVVDDLAFYFEEYERLKYSSDYSYINTGVMLVNLKYWRDHNITEKFINYLSLNLNDIIHHDQDIINGVLNDSTVMLPYKYNMHTNFYRKKICLKCNFNEDLLYEGRKHPVIIHYTGRKPWHKDSFVVRAEEYIYYKSLTKWEKHRLVWTDSNLNRKIKYYKRRLLQLVGIRFQRDRVD